jgi:3D (Asp-Asp-Asp) domain-containing protein
MTLIIVAITIYPMDVIAPMGDGTQTLDLVQRSRVQISRGEPAPRIDSRVMKITDYTASDKGMNGKGITTSGERVLEGRTIAADIDIPFGSQIYIPDLNRTYIVTDRGGAIHGDRLDLYMENRKDAMKFGVQELEVFIRE